MYSRARLLEPGGALRGKIFRDLLRKRFAHVRLDPDDRVGAWRIVRELGRGGMGLVYLAERADGEFDQHVALKWLPDAAAAPCGEALFRRERQILAGLSHPAIARLMDGGHTDSGHLWFAMEYVEGLPIDQHAQANDLSERERIGLLRPVLEAVAFAHARLVIHRDIKPANVLVDLQGHPKLLDFGIAGLAADGDHAIAFTPDYASPEQRASQPVGTASDIWQLGRLLETVLTAGAVRPLPRDLEAIMAMATAAHPRDRYATVVAMKADLLSYLDHRPVLARQAGAAYRLACCMQRHPIGAAASVLATAVLIGLLVGFFLYAAAEQRRLKRASNETAAINQFLSEDVLGASDPFSGQGGPGQVVDTLEHGVKRAKLRFRDHPAIEGRTLVALGHSLLMHGRYEAALGAADRAVKLLQQVDGPDARTTADALLLRAAVDMHLGRAEEADKRLQALHAAFPYRANAASTLEWRIQVERAWNANLRSRYDECAAILTSILAQPGQTTDAERGLAYTTLSTCQASSGRLREALGNAMVSERLAIAEMGRDSPQATLAGQRIAVALSGLGRHEEATQRFQVGVEQLIRLVGEDHGTTAAYMDHFGRLLLCANRNEEAAAWTARGLRVRRTALGPTHPWTIGVEAQYIVALLRSGQVEQARALVSHVEAWRKQPDLGSQLWIYRALAEWYLHENRPAQAAAYYHAAHLLAVQPGMEVRSGLHAIDGHWALALAQAGRIDQARETFRRYDANVAFANACVSPLQEQIDVAKGRIMGDRQDNASAVLSSTQ